MKRFGYTSHSCVYPGDSFIIKSTDYDFTILTISKINRVLLSPIIKTLFGDKVLMIGLNKTLFIFEIVNIVKS